MTEEWVTLWGRGGRNEWRTRLFRDRSRSTNRQQTKTKKPWLAIYIRYNQLRSGSIKLVRTEERFANTRLIKSLIVTDFKHEKKQNVRLIPSRLFSNFCEKKWRIRMKWQRENTDKWLKKILLHMAIEKWYFKINLWLI